MSRSAIRPGIRAKLVLLSLLIVVVASFGFSLLHRAMTHGATEEDLRERAVAFAREIAATIGDRREFESGPLLRAQIARIMSARQNVLQLDVLGFEPDATAIVATSHPTRRLPLQRADVQAVTRGQVSSRLVRDASSRHWEVVAPVVLDGIVVGAVAAKFSLQRADALAWQIQRWDLVLTTASVLVMALLMSIAVQRAVKRPVQRLLDAIERIEGGDATSRVAIDSNDEFRVVAGHFNRMLERLAETDASQAARIKAATAELEARYREVERLNEVLFATQRSLGHAERLAMSGRLMAQVAHEVGTPLYSITAHLQLLRQDLGEARLDGRFAPRLDIVDGQLRRVTEIIAQLLELTRRPAAASEPVDLNRLVRETLDVIRPGLVSRGLTIEAVADLSLPALHGRHDQFQQILLNLVTNAIDATPPGGTITVATIHDPDRAQIEVTDTGHGIPKAEQPRIFEPFFSTKEPRRGTGLGLFIVAEIVREHGGRIEVTSEPGQGSTFRVSLPLANDRQ